MNISLYNGCSIYIHKLIFFFKVTTKIPVLNTTTKDAISGLGEKGFATEHALSPRANQALVPRVGSFETNTTCGHSLSVDCRSGRMCPW